jgi:hypothetical protein
VHAAGRRASSRCVPLSRFYLRRNLPGALSCRLQKAHGRCRRAAARAAGWAARSEAPVYTTSTTASSRRRPAFCRSNRAVSVPERARSGKCHVLDSIG